MSYIVLFEDNPGTDDIRQRHMAEHLRFLESHAGAVAAAGPLLEPATGAPAGGLWVVRAGDEQAVRELVETDPLWPTGLRRSVRILAWRQVFAEGRRRI